MTKAKTTLVVTLAVAAAFSYRLAAQSASRFIQPDPIDFEEHAGWTSMFDGSTLKGWDGSSDVWHVENGAITGESSPEKPAGTTYVVWQGGELKNFELKAEVKLEGTGANSGIQYRSARTTQTQGDRFQIHDSQNGISRATRRISITPTATAGSYMSKARRVELSPGAGRWSGQSKVKSRGYWARWVIRMCSRASSKLAIGTKCRWSRAAT